MTGKELIFYILNNDLLNEPIFTDNKILGLLTIDEAAIKRNVGRATIITYIKMKRIDSITINGVTFIIDNDKLKIV